MVLEFPVNIVMNSSSKNIDNSLLDGRLCGMISCAYQIILVWFLLAQNSVEGYCV